MTTLTAVNATTFQDVVLSSSLPVIVDFWATWCGPCKVLGAELERLAPTYRTTLKFCAYDLDAGSEIPNRFGIRSVPTLLAFRAGTVVDQVIGAVARKDLVAFLDRLAGTKGH
ncbi:MAG: hypothetical protein A2284_08430 [Deltaproteobacteria bacterium RIFOXYA12_FULL_61_11]|nr:MAG: hypothetical protein A2284_08430 [Deltaproteobacteria bacterium RIFOXYA12_FULL_61_11]